MLTSLHNHKTRLVRKKDPSHSKDPTHTGRDQQVSFRKPTKSKTTAPASSSPSASTRRSHSAQSLALGNLTHAALFCSFCVDFQRNGGLDELVLHATQHFLCSPSPPESEAKSSSNRLLLRDLRVCASSDEMPWKSAELRSCPVCFLGPFG